MKTHKVRIWTSSDGIEFFSGTECIKHEVTRSIVERLKADQSMQTGLNFDHVAEAIVRNAEGIYWDTKRLKEAQVEVGMKMLAGVKNASTKA